MRSEVDEVTVKVNFCFLETMQYSSGILAIILLLLQGSHTINSDKFLIVAAEKETNTTTPPTYRVSIPKSKEPLNRVPTHLQDIHYIYKEADDVIHIIEPPQHFQLMKNIMNQTNHNKVKTKKQTPNLRMIRPKSTNQISTSLSMNADTVKILSEPVYSAKVNKLLPDFIPNRTSQLRQQLGGNKVNRWLPPHLASHKRKYKPIKSEMDTADSISQGTQIHQQQVLPVLPQMPREVLASVRKTERILKPQQQKLQHASQRHKTLKTHTIIMEQLYDHNKFQRGSEHKSMGEKWRKIRVRRDLNDQSLPGARRADQKSAALDALYNAKKDVQKGTKLVLHLNDLLKNANLFLPDEGEVVDFNTKYNIDINEELNLGNHTKSYPGAEDFRKFIEKSLNTTDLLKRNFSSKQKRNKNEKRDDHSALEEIKPRNNKNRVIRVSHNTRIDQDAAGILLYDDIMANIRNMLQVKNFQHLGEHSKRNFNKTKISINSNSCESYLSNNKGELIEVKQLENYIDELRQLAKRLPNTNESTERIFDAQESINTDLADWYLIDSENTTHTARSDFKPKSSSSFVHYSPDIKIKQAVVANNQKLLRANGTLS